MSGIRHVVLVLGDQLTFDNPALAGFDPRRDRLLMIEAPGEATHVWSTKPRIAMFLAAMRHFAAEILVKGWPLEYVHLDDAAAPTLAERLAAQLRALAPSRVRVCEPGEYRVRDDLRRVCRETGVPLDACEDTHFLCSHEGFAEWAGDAATLRMEFFYREMRRRTGSLMVGAKPAGGVWNFDKENRGGFGRGGPGMIPAAPSVAPDAITRDVFSDVERLFADHPGSLASFDWPVTRADALAWLEDFIAHRLPAFGTFQDAMWTDTPFPCHSRPSAALNLKLIDTREGNAAAEAAYRAGRAPLASVEGFIRQILGWREFVRGVYWLDMPGLAEANHFGHDTPLPAWFWTGRTQMRCMAAAVGQTLQHGYAHHIQRLMLLGNFALLAGIVPQSVCDWFLAVYVDAVEWVELPNTAGMALYANGGRFTSKPYAASGAYVKRMSNYCDGCRYRPDRREGPDACPFNVLYWHFLDRHERELAGNPRTALMVRNLARLAAADRRGIRTQAGTLLDHLEAL